MDFIIGLVVITIGLLFVYVGAHMSEEKRQKKHIPLAWEEGGFLNNMIKGKK